MTDGGEFAVRTRANPNPPPGTVIIEFKDQGIGIKKDTHQYLFRPFFTTKLRGTGLGLAICRRIVMERHDGNIRVESEWGKGTTVTVELPVGPT
jgi:two-component system NtrC family sensor kinase